jgi:XTP/dITP diphosphohydrolase
VDPEARLGASLLATVAAAREAGLDAEAALRRAALAYADAVRAAERRPSTPPAEPR